MAGIDNFLNNNNNNFEYFLNSGNNTAQANSHAASSIPAISENKVSQKVETKTQTSAPVNTSAVCDEFVKIKKHNGIIRKFYNFLKNSTGIGTGSKAVEKEIDRYEKGEVSKEQLDNKINKYKISQENGTQTAGDIAAGAVSIGAYMTADKYLKKFRAKDKLGIKSMLLDEILDNLKKNSLPAKIASSGYEALKSNTKSKLLLLPILAMLGGTTKQIITDIDLIGSKEYSVKKKDYKDKKEYKAAKKAARKGKIKQRMKNFFTGAVSGVLAPVTAIAGGIVGVPLYLAGTFGLRYVSNKNDNDKKSLSDFGRKFTDNAAVNTIGALLIAIPAFKKAHYNGVLGKNLNKVVEKLKGQNLQLPDLPSSKSAYQELEDMMLNSHEIKSILECFDKTMDEKIQALTNENIFAAKFLQIKNEGIYSDVSSALREDCPPTRTLAQAQEFLDTVWESGKYTVSKLVGVGTVAETYLAKDKSGKKVCIKILKNGIDAEKIKTDKEKFLKLVIGDTPKDKLTENQKYLIKNIENLANDISKEVDLKNEMENAKNLKKYCEVADVIKPIEVKDGAYVMEQAPGISVKTLADYYSCESLLKFYKKMQVKYPKKHHYAELIAEQEAKMQKIKARAPEFADFEMKPSQIKRLLNAYIDLQIEQFSKIDKNGKLIHGDIHPGNIFINLENLKSGKGKLFTLIDTGNTIHMSKDQAKAALRLTTFIKNGDVKDLTSTVLDGAILPAGMTKEQAAQKVEADLRTYFFDNKTKIDIMNIDTFYALSDNILRKYNIIPNNTQLNLNKAKISAKNSYNNLKSSFFEKKFGDIDFDEQSKLRTGLTIGDAAKDFGLIKLKENTAQAFQETKNLFQMGWREALEYLRNPNKLKTNSEDYLTFELKQSMPGPEKLDPFEL